MKIAGLVLSGRVSSRLALVVFSLMVLGLLVIATGCSESTSDELERVRVEDIEYQLLQGGARILTGSVVNTSDAHIPIAQIRVTLFDEYNRSVDQMMIVVRDIPVGEEIRFREAVRSDFDIRGARARSVLIP